MEEMNDVHAVIADVLKRRSLDHRMCFTAVYAKPPGGRPVIECSDRDVRDDVERQLGERLGLEAPPIEYVLLPDGERGLPERLIAASSVVDVRRKPDHTSELLTQSIYGDAMTPLKQEGDWWLVKLHDGYIGRVRSWHLTPFSTKELQRFEAEARHRVVGNVIQIFEEPDEMSRPVSDAVVGTRVSASTCGKRGWRAVGLPDGRDGFAKARGVGRIPATRRVLRDGLAATGMRFLGIPYLWGGTTPKGFDCSGLMQRIYLLHGVLIPRDSDIQAQWGRLKPSDSVENLDTGDLLFFGKSDDQISHVAMVLSNGLFLHAYGQVKVGALDPRHALFEPGLTRDWRCTRDPLSD
jgi:cell wall-associated NlpC family hydrolase